MADLKKYRFVRASFYMYFSTIFSELCLEELFWRTVFHVFSFGVLTQELFKPRGVGKILKTFLYGKAPPRGPTPYLVIIYHFWQKMSPFRILSINLRYPFHIPSLEQCKAFTAVIALSLKCRWLNHKPESFHSHKMHLLALLDPLFTNRNDRSPYPFIYLYFNKWNPYPFISLTWRLRKVPIWGGASLYGPSSGVPPFGIKPQQVLTCNATRMYLGTLE